MCLKELHEKRLRSVFAPRGCRAFVSADELWPLSSLGKTSICQLKCLRELPMLFAIFMATSAMPLKEVHSTKVIMLELLY
jgi:hypothetical protein